MYNNNYFLLLLYKMVYRRRGMRRKNRNYGKRVRLSRNPSGNRRVFPTMNRLIRGNRSNMVHNYKRNVGYLAITVDPTTSQYRGAWIFKLNDVNNSAEYKALYDQYKLNYVVLKVIHRSTNISQMETYDQNSMGFPYMYYVIDRDDNTAPADMDEIREYSSSKMFVFTPDKRVCYIKLKPSQLAMSYLSTTATSYNIVYNRWTDWDDNGATPHYGVKLVIINPQTSTNVRTSRFDVEATYYFSCKTPK